MKAAIARKQAGQGFMCDTTIKGPHGSCDGNTSIFRGLSRVPAFFSNPESYLTPKARSQGVCVLLVKGLDTWMCVNECLSVVDGERQTEGERMRKKKTGKRRGISRLERRRPLGFYLRDIHLVSEFICSIYYSSVCVLTGMVVLLNSSGTCPSGNRETAG